MSSEITKEDDKAINAILDHGESVQHLIYLKDRWADEKMYEDWSDYEASMRKNCMLKNVSFIKGLKRPFGFQVLCGTNTFNFILENCGKGYVKFVAKKIK